MERKKGQVKGKLSRRGKPESSQDANLQKQGHYPRRKVHEKKISKGVKGFREDEGGSSINREQFGIYIVEPTHLSCQNDTMPCARFSINHTMKLSIQITAPTPIFTKSRLHIELNLPTSTIGVVF
jgi:hypothetical protein